MGSRRTKISKLKNSPGVTVALGLPVFVAIFAGAYFLMARDVSLPPYPASAPRVAALYDNRHRLVRYAGKIEAKCPAQDEKTAVLLAIGQSNAANNGVQPFTTHYPKQVFNYFDGACTVAASPLLGASGEGGEFLTPLADELIAGGDYSSVVILTSAIGSTSIERWRQGGDMNAMLAGVLDQARKDYAITAILWDQGESDFLVHTSARSYADSFHSLQASLAAHGVNAPIFIAIATKCQAEPWQRKNPVARAQHMLIDDRNVFLGADTDGLLGPDERAPDGCHFNGNGQMKAARAFAAAIMRERKHT